MTANPTLQELECHLPAPKEPAHQKLFPELPTPTITLLTQRTARLMLTALRRLLPPQAQSKLDSPSTLTS